MRSVLDTNVFISAVFFHGRHYDILKAWDEGRVALVLSPEILDEYRRVGHVLANRYPGVDLSPFLALAASHAEIVAAPPFATAVCRDPDDDMFLACAVAGRADAIVTGDRDLLDLHPFGSVDILKPSELLARLADQYP